MLFVQYTQVSFFKPPFYSRSCVFCWRPVLQGLIFTPRWSHAKWFKFMLLRGSQSTVAWTYLQKKKHLKHPLDSVCKYISRVLMPCLLHVLKYVTVAWVCTGGHSVCGNSGEEEANLNEILSINHDFALRRANLKEKKNHGQTVLNAVWIISGWKWGT